MVPAGDVDATTEVGRAVAVTAGVLPAVVASAAGVPNGLGTLFARVNACHDNKEATIAKRTNPTSASRLSTRPPGSVRLAGHNLSMMLHRVAVSLSSGGASP